MNATYKDVVKFTIAKMIQRKLDWDRKEQESIDDKKLNNAAIYDNLSVGIETALFDIQKELKSSFKNGNKFFLECVKRAEKFYGKT